MDLFYSLPNRPKGKGVTVNISVACFVPKPFTPFEFEPQDTPEQFVAKQKLLLETVSSRKISISYHDSGTSRIEAILARGDRRLADVVEAVWRDGGRLEGWEDHLPLPAGMMPWKRPGSRRTFTPPARESMTS